MGGSQSAPAHERHVVIVGAGYGGISCAAKLDEYCKVTLIDAKDVFHHNLGALRCLVEPSFTKMTLIPYDKLLRFGTFRHGWVDRLNLSQKTVFFSSGEELQFDYIVIACGSSVPFPGKNIICTAHKDKVHVLKKITRNTTNQGCKVSDLNKLYNY